MPNEMRTQGCNFGGAERDVQGSLPLRDLPRALNQPALPAQNWEQKKDLRLAMEVAMAGEEAYRRAESQPPQHQLMEPVQEEMREQLMVSS